METSGGDQQEGSLGYPTLKKRKVVGIYKKVAWDIRISHPYMEKCVKDLQEGSLVYPLHPYMEKSSGDLREGSLVYPTLTWRKVVGR